MERVERPNEYANPAQGSLPSKFNTLITYAILHQLFENKNVVTVCRIR